MIRQFISNLPIPRKLTLILGLFCAAVLCLLILSGVGMEILSGSRAYVGGEALWSKGEKTAIYHLTRYALYDDESDYQTYLDSIAVPLGDHVARVELARPTIDKKIVRQGFVQGRNHADDVPIMTFMARHLNEFHYMHQALAIWGQADDALAMIPPLADALHREVASAQPSAARVRALLNQIQAIDSQLTPLEDNFSYTLGEGARWLKHFLLWLMGVATLGILAVTLGIAVLISRHLSSEILHLRAGAAQIAAGDYSLSLHTDSTDEIGDLARSFQEMAAQRQHAERLKDEFFANISHELRTPLTLILSPLESLLGADSARDPQARALLATMHRNTLRLLQLVNGLLDFSKLEAGQLHVHREPLRLTDLTRMVYDDFQPLLRGKQLEGSLVMDDAEQPVLMDHYLYERILFNLLGNAIKFTPSGGRVEIRLSWAADRLTLAVTDSGIGIPASAQARIFQRFHQVESSSTRRFEGTGLGLALVKEFAGLLEGTVAVASAPGKGSTFTVQCAAPRTQAAGTATVARTSAPRAWHFEQESAAAPLAAESPAMDRALPRVLIAEDNAEMAAYITTLLRPLCQTRVARNGREALELLRAWPADLVLSDVMMPERDGLSLCRDIKDNPATADIPVVLLTALTHRDALLEGWKAGANEYLFKPFHPQELLTRVQALLSARRQRQRAEAKIARLNNSLRRHALKLAAANQELEAFSYSAAHDLRTPLRAIDGFSHELLTNYEAVLDERGKEDLRRIRAATQRMGRLIDDLLELSRMARADLQKEDIDLSALVNELIQKQKESDAAPQKTVYAVTPGLHAQADARLVQIALSNLLQNAWKFTRQAPHPEITFGVLDAGAPAPQTFYLRDNGAGFDMTYADKLFKPFQRLHDPKEFPGTGIGLALVRRIFSRHGGRIWAEAEKNRGATFYFTL